MARTAEEQTVVPIERLHRALKTVLWGGFFAGGMIAGIDPFNDHDRVSLNLVALVGGIVLLVGLRDLPFGRGNPLARRRNLVVTGVIITLVAAVATVAPPARAAGHAVAQISGWTSMVLLLALVGSVMGDLGASDLGRTWRRLTVAWAAVGATTVAISAALARQASEPSLVGVSSTTPTSSTWTTTVGWQVVDLDRPAWAVALSLVLWAASLAVGIWLIVAAVSTMRWLRSRIGPAAPAEGRVEHGGPTPPSTDERHPADLDRRADGPRLRRDGDRTIYYVDPEP